MSETKTQEQLFKALDHEIRREILKRMGENPATYTELLKELGIESGHLAYHLRNMEELLEKDSDGFYSLTRSGKRAFSFLMEEPFSKPRKDNPFILVSLAAILFLTVVVASCVFISVTNRERLDQQKLEQLQIEASLQIDAALNTIYQIFEHYETPREKWMELFMKTVMIRRSLEETSEYKAVGELDSIISKLEEYESEMFQVLKHRDEKYLELTVEKRYIVRELQTLLLEIDVKIS